MYSALIIDDEQVFRNGLKSFLDWHDLGFSRVEDAVNGEQAVNMMMERHFDVVISDISMPGMDGLQLAQWINKTCPDTKVILLTAYAYFTYAQSAIQSGIIDYIVKSDPLEPLRNAIIKAIGIIERDGEERKRLIKLEKTIIEFRGDAQSKFLYDLLSGIAINDPQTDKRSGQLGVSLNRYCCVIFEPIGKARDNSIMKFILKYFHDNTNGYQLLLSNNHCCAIILLDDTQNVYEYIRQLLNTFANTLSSIVDCQIYAGISQIYLGIHNMEKAYRQAHDMLFSSNPDTPHIYAEDSQATDDGALAGNRYDKVLQSIQIGLKALRDEPLREFIHPHVAKLMQNESTLWRIATLQAIVSFILKNQGNSGLNANLNNYVDVFINLQHTNSEDEIVDLIVSLCSGKNEKANPLAYSQPILETVKFIHAHFSEDINLHMIAMHVHLNDSYLSRRYKQEVGENIISTITRLRIERACMLLESSDQTVSMIGYKVGYEDAAHFCNVFKKYMSASPSEYRSNDNMRQW